MAKKKADRPHAQELIAACRLDDLASAGMPGRVRARLALAMKTPAAYKAVARILFYLMEGGCFHDHLSAHDIAQAIEAGPRYFGDVNQKSLESFAKRTTDRPDDARYFEYVRFVALILGRDHHLNRMLRDDPFLSEILSEWNVVDLYNAARDLESEAEFRALIPRPTVVVEAKGGFPREVVRQLKLQSATMADVRRQILRGKVKVGKETFYSFRYTVTPSVVSCCRVEVTAPPEAGGLLEFVTENVRSEGKEHAQQESSGYVFGFESTIFFVGRLKGGLGMNCLAIPRFFGESNGRMFGLVLTPDITVRQPIVAARLALIREDKIKPSLRKKLHTGTMNSDDLFDAISDGPIADYIGNTVETTVRSDIRLGEEFANNKTDMLRLMAKLMKKAGENDAWPFTTVAKTGEVTDVSPFEILRYESALRVTGIEGVGEGA